MGHLPDVDLTSADVALTFPLPRFTIDSRKTFQPAFFTLPIAGASVEDAGFCNGP
jgi:hypothetical protein